MLISVNYAECSNMDFKENEIMANIFGQRKKREGKKEHIYYCLLLKREIYDFNIKFHKPFCTKALREGMHSFCNKVSNNFTTVERKTSPRVT